MAGLCLRLRDRPSGDAEIWNDRFARLLRRRSALAEALRLFRAGCANAVGGSGRMKFTLSWLKDHLETNATVDEIVGTLTRIGLEVEGVENTAEKLAPRSEEHTSELQSLMRNSYADFCLKKKRSDKDSNKQHKVQTIYNI